MAGKPAAGLFFSNRFGIDAGEGFTDHPLGGLPTHAGLKQLRVEQAGRRPASSHFALNQAGGGRAVVDQADGFEAVEHGVGDGGLEALFTQSPGEVGTGAVAGLEQAEGRGPGGLG